MSDRGIMFTGPNVLAILAGLKWQTRRHADRQVRFSDAGRSIKKHVVRSEPSVWTWVRPGDRLWVKEDFYLDDEAYHGRRAGLIIYRAEDKDGWNNRLAWREARLMPRWASRLTLVVTDIRRQRLDDISEADAVAEGAPDLDGFKAIWASIHGPKAWAQNRQVIAITFSAFRGCILDHDSDRQLIPRAA